MSEVDNALHREITNAAKIKLIAGPDTNGIYVFEDANGKFQLFRSGEPLRANSDVQYILNNGRWLGKWHGSAW